MTFLSVFLIINDGDVHEMGQGTLGGAYITRCASNHVHFCT